MQGAYLGPAFANAEIADRLRKAGAVFEIVEDEAVIGRTVDALVDDYLRDNPTRNRPLDMLPAFCTLRPTNRLAFSLAP